MLETPKEGCEFFEQAKDVDEVEIRQVEDLVAELILRRELGQLQWTLFDKLHKEGHMHWRLFQSSRYCKLLNVFWSH